MKCNLLFFSQRDIYCHRKIILATVQNMSKKRRKTGLQVTIKTICDKQKFPVTRRALLSQKENSC